MNNTTQNTIIALLLVSAVILGALLLASHSGQNALASTAAARYGDYLMVPCALTNNRDFIYIIDIVAKRLNVYVPDEVSGKIEMLPDAGVDLGKAFQ